jgi:hypothetical protein
MKNSWTRTKENVEKITKRNNSALNLRQAEWTKKNTKENEIKFCRIDRITVESTFSATSAARAERERWHSIIYESIYLYLISFLICFVISSSLISVSSHHMSFFLYQMTRSRVLIIDFRDFKQIRAIDFKDLHFFFKFQKLSQHILHFDEIVYRQ